MHRALCISEILREILLYASEQCISDANRSSRYVCPWHASGDELGYCLTSCLYDVEARKGRTTPRHRFLRAVALSCKTFSDVALDLLWRALDSPEPLRALKKYYIGQGINPDSLETYKRYRTYTNRIRGVYFGMDALVCSSERNNSTRNSKRTKQYFTLPRLRSIRIDVAPSNLQRHSGLLTNTLVDVSLTFVGDQRHWSKERASGYVNNYLRSLANQTSLQTLQLDWLPIVPDPTTLTFLARLSTLHVALVASVADSLPLLAALHASSIPHIRLYIEQAGCDLPTMEYFRTRLGGPIELYVRGGPSALCLDQLIGLFATREHETEQELHLTCELEYNDSCAFVGSGCLLSSAVVGSLISAMRCPRSTVALALRAFDIAEPLTDADDDAFSFSSIQPLLKIRQMVRFEVAANVPFSLSDTDIAVLARAWPELEALEVRLHHSTPQGCAPLPKRCPTLRSLVVLARHCPRLASLYIPFRAAIDGVPAEEWPKRGEAHETLKRLTVDGGEILCGESQKVGVALEELFPRATLDTQNVFDIATWDYIVEARMRHRLYNMAR